MTPLVLVVGQGWGVGWVEHIEDSKVVVVGMPKAARALTPSLEEWLLKSSRAVLGAIGGAWG